MHKSTKISEECKTVVLHNIIAPYKTLLFGELYKIYHQFSVLYMAEIENNREWNIDHDLLDFPHEIMFEGPLDNISAVRLITKTWSKLNSIKPDVIILGGYSYSACWAAFLWARINSRKIILWSSSNADDRKRTKLKEKLKTFLVGKCDAANVYGQRSRDYLVKLGIQKDRIFITGNTTDNNFYYNQTRKLKKDRPALCSKCNIPEHNFLYIGRFSPEKNILSLLNAYRRLKAEKCNWGLILTGAGPQKEDIESFIKKYALKDVYMPGFKQKEEMPLYLAISDVLILPSTYEPWGLVVNEAMASGLPVLVSKKCGCYPNLIKESVNGFSFDPFDENELLNCMKKIIENKEHLKKMGESSLDLIKNYTPENAAKVILKTIEFTLNGESKKIRPNG